MEAFLIVLIPFVLIAVHEAGHYLAGLNAGIPARDMRIVLFAFPQHVALRDGDSWVSPTQNINRYIEVSRRYLWSRSGAFGYVAGGVIVEGVFVTALSLSAAYLGWQLLAFWAPCISLGMYAINVVLMDLPWALYYRTVCGDTSGLWAIARFPAVLLTIVMVSLRGGLAWFVAW